MIKQIAFVVCTLFLLGFFSFATATTSNDNLNVDLRVDGCNNNGMCEAGIGENISSCPNDCTPSSLTPTGGSSTGGYQPLYFHFTDLLVSADENRAYINWSSRHATLSRVDFGTTADYLDGSIRNVVFTTKHKVVIDNLKPGTKYYFNIESSDIFGLKKSLNGIFFTTAIPNIRGPLNVSGFNARALSSVIELKWRYPKNFKDKNFDYVRIMRNNNRFHSSPYEGSLIYEGRAEHFIDSGIAIGRKYFYTLFVRSTNGDYSSGALASATIRPINNTKNSVIEKSDIPLSAAQGTEVSGLTYLVSQGGKTTLFNRGQNIKLYTNQSITITAIKTKKDDLEDILVNLKKDDSLITSLFFFGPFKDKNIIDTESDLKSESRGQVEIPSISEPGLYQVGIVAYTRSSDSQFLIHKGVFEIENFEPTDEKTTEPSNSLVFLGFLLMVIMIVALIQKLISRKK